MSNDSRDSSAPDPEDLGRRLAESLLGRVDGERPTPHLAAPLPEDTGTTQSSQNDPSAGTAGVVAAPATATVRMRPDATAAAETPLARATVRDPRVAASHPQASGFGSPPATTPTMPFDRAEAALRSGELHDRLGSIRVDHLYPDDGEIEDDSRAQRRSRALIEWLAVIAAAVVLTLVAQMFVVESFEIPSGSMIPTLEVNDRVMVNKLSYRFNDIGRGDVVVFDRPATFPKRVAAEPDQLIKRVIGLPGDTVSARDGVVYVNDKALDEPYLDESTVTDRIDQVIVVPDDSIFVMGDNREASEDSRAVGPIPIDLVVGRAALRFCLCTDTERFERL